MTTKGLTVQTPAAAIVDISAHHGAMAGIVTADAALHRGLKRQELEVATHRFGSRAGSVAVRRVARLADGRIESPDKSRLRLVCLGAGYDLTPQFVVRNARGEEVAQADFLVTGTNVVIGFGSTSPYAPGSGRRKEKARRHEIERCGYVVVQALPGDLERPKRLLDRMEDAVATFRARHPPSGTS